MSSSLCDSLKCAQCNCTETLLWKSIGVKQQLCNNCYEENKNHTKQEGETHRKTDDRRTKLRKSTRSTRYGKNSSGTANASGPLSSNTNKSSTAKTSGRGRRNLCRRPPIKALSIPARTKCVNSLFFKVTQPDHMHQYSRFSQTTRFFSFHILQGSYIQIGDIVSMWNSNYDKFYAQIRGLMIDNFCEKSAFLTWLLPTKNSPPPGERFDASTYVVGPEEDHPRLLSCMEFVMHAPSDYYHDKSTPYPPIDSNPYGSPSSSSTAGGFIWTNI